MASSALRRKRENFRDPRSSSESAALRLSAAERPEEILPILLEEIVHLGFPSALALELDFDTGQIKPSASLNCSPEFLGKFNTSLWASENPFVSSLLNLKPLLTPDGVVRNGALYAHPMIYRNVSRCWEAERDRRSDCLAVQNAESSKLQIQQQVCSACGMRSYVNVVIGQLGRRTGQTQLRQFHNLVERANRQLSRLFKVEHYYNRMRDMEITISRMTTVMESMADPVILTDNQHRVIIQNRAAERFFRVPEGVSEGGRRAVEFNNLLFSAALSSMTVSASDSSRDLTLVDVMEGEEILFEAVCAPTYIDETRTGMVTVMRDVTDLRRADQELRTNLDKLRAAEEIVRQDRDRLNVVIENVGDPIVVADNSAKIVLLDPLAKELFATGAAVREPQMVKNEAKLDAYLTSFTFSFLDHQNKALHLFNPAIGGEVEYAARSGKIYDARGQVAYTVTVLRDFSTWKRLEQLQMERRMLEMEKFAATGRLAGTIAHEINNPMEAIKNAIFLLRNKVEPDAQQIYDALKSETDRVTRIVRQMLGLYRNAGHLATFDLNLIVEDTLTLFSRPLAKDGITVEKQFGQLPPTKGSADQFRQLLSNLVVNAQDSMVGGGKLTIRTSHIRSTRGSYEQVSLVVADTGTGIPNEIRKTMFEPFVTTKGEKGTGLGLWIVKGIVENHGGRIYVRSSAGKGTIFKIVFPVSRV
ncbi:MAG: sensor signal transduction histidine kinase [Acidobacteriaceae bacterium]|nr:sensor signal transduction histidine kinase [Acidobacteriaceae bacterium]